MEVIQKISDDPKTVCPKCGNKSLKKLISAPSFRLKGSGWYETDFKTGKKKNLVKEDKETKKESKKDSSKKSKEIEK